ncbi:MAG: Acetyltransferase (GNAT) family protein [Deltaproteobacteria bacterium ADurb.BinA179]|jgi:GNAT superfamily N-acetyltransferase|nr:GNAT family N-acetyltransferase [Bacteriovoracaceae bacterium]OPZ24851.1 MAG: Acetyltransferase (GNAT) family protein [Deltaproteobacteria bacterium ADurb.BinA179]HNR51746.1 GNAT family N-acetyltransferase [Deltaproteobacteria bacterium]HRR19777.1 GNAT family N-acetyltransferase [Desulfomonilia bacterium]HNU74570.1 GNAT family N-acetyltransferase [Deltaproteobacteria bacterium]
MTGKRAHDFDLADLVYRTDVYPHDIEAVRAMVESTGFFSPDEVLISLELVDERLKKGERSGYHFIFAQERDGRAVGYTCFGPIPGTLSGFDLYWIVVSGDRQGRGIGRELLTRTERAAALAGCTRMYAETSSRKLYEPTRKFYLASGYRREAFLRDFYSPGDSKIIYVKTLP